MRAASISTGTMLLPFPAGVGEGKPRGIFRSRPSPQSAPGRVSREALARVCLIGLLILSCALSMAAAPATQPVHYTSEQIDSAIARGVEFLEKDQQPDGSWGSGLKTHGTEVYSMVPGSLISYRIATTALCVMALHHAGETQAHDKGLEYLLKAPDARRDDGDLLYNTWAHFYRLQACAEEMSNNHHDPRLKAVAEREIHNLIRYATYIGGWNYYDFPPRQEAYISTQHPTAGPTSFGTAAGLVALYEAKQAGLAVPQKLIEQSIRRLEEMRLPSGIYLYGEEYKYVPRLPANLPKGAVGRTQPVNYALRLWGSKKIGKDELRSGLELFVKDHAFLDMGRKRPIPHEAWYQTAGYYYYFDHYYASRLFELLDADDKAEFAPYVLAGILPHQESDGSWWDFPMWDFHKPYGTAFAVMTLMRCK